MKLNIDYVMMGIIMPIIVLMGIIYTWLQISRIKEEDKYLEKLAEIYVDALYDTNPKNRKKNQEILALLKKELG